MMDDDRLAYLRSIVLARCPEIDAADLALLAEDAPSEAVSSEVLHLVIDVVDELDRKLTMIEQGLASPRFTY